MVRHELGGTAFGLNQIDFPPFKVGPEHDELQSGQEEIYYCVSGSGTLTVDGEPVEMHPGLYILVSADASDIRRPVRPGCRSSASAACREASTSRGCRPRTDDHLRRRGPLRRLGDERLDDGAQLAAQILVWL